MSEQNTPLNQPPADEIVSSGGYEEEGVGQQQKPEEAAASKAQEKTAQRSKSDEMKRNFSAVFGHGIGKVSLIVVAIVIAISAGLGYRGLTRKPKEVASTSEVDVPTAPPPSVDIGAVSKLEAERRAQRAALEAEEAANQGQTYQPGFDTNIVANPSQSPTGQGIFNVPIQQDGRRPPSPQGGPAAPAVPSVATGQATANQTASTVSTATGQTAQQSAQAAQAEQQARQKLEQELKQAQAERDKYVATMKEQVLKQAQTLFGESGQGGLNAQGAYSTVSYYPVVRGNASTPAGNASSSLTPQAASALPETLGDPNRNLLIKTGNMMYATLDSEVNTDDGGDVLATIRGGKWDGAKIIGRVEQAPNNIRLKFTTMAPQDGRPTMKINAVALREEDAKQGIAEDIDHHTLERYSALAVASLLSGYGRAYAQPTGTTIVTNGTVVTTSEEPSDEKVIASAVGEMGQAMGAEMRRGFNRPSTYSTPAQQGFGLFFMQDVHEPK